jgi:hypothetical protein
MRSCVFGIQENDDIKQVLGWTGISNIYRVRMEGRDRRVSAVHLAA